jgi:hypothetical protein
LRPILRAGSIGDDHERYVRRFLGGFAVPSARRTSPRIETFIRSETFERPTLVLDIDAVEAQYRSLKAGLGRADIHYAVKANPAREIIERWSTSAPISTPPRAGRSSFASRSAHDPRRCPSATR